jgi:Disulfide bond chaperones of the HSP33 family
MMIQSTLVLRFSSVKTCAFSPILVHHRRSSISFAKSLSTFQKNKGRDGRLQFLFVKDTIADSSTTTTASSSSRQSTTLFQTSSSSSSSSSRSPQGFETYKNKNNLDDQLVSFLSGNGEIKVTACTIRNLVNDAMIQQSLTPTPANILARSMACSLLLSNGMQKEQTFQLTMACDGPIRTVVSIANAVGEVRGYAGNPGLGQMYISEAIGRGTVQVVKMHPDWPRPYNGVTAIEHGDIDRDVGIYLAESEQRACALAAAATFNGILCTAAGGYVVEQLPGCTEETSARVEENLAKLVERNGGDDLPAGMLLSGGTPLDICTVVLEGLDMKPLECVHPKLVCKCSEDRLFRALRLLPRGEVDRIIMEEEKIEARCEFCGRVYRMGPKEIAKRFEEATGDPSVDDDFQSLQ